MNSTLKEILDVRTARYGTFYNNAATTQSLTTTLRNHHRWDTLHPVTREALEMIVHKIGRILNGDQTYDDNWLDISGYAQQAAAFHNQPNMNTEDGE